MDYEIRELLAAATKAVQERNAAAWNAQAEALPDSDKIQALRDLDEKVCLRSRSLYMRFKSTALWCRAVDENTFAGVKKTLQEAVDCLPKDDYTAVPKEEYNIRRSVAGRREDFNKLAKKLVADPARPGWLVIPIPKPDDLLQPA